VDVAEASSLTRLDSCTVQVDPPMTEAMEHLRMPENLMKQLHIVADTTPTGLVLTGENQSDLQHCIIVTRLLFLFRLAVPPHSGRQADDRRLLKYTMMSNNYCSAVNC